MPDPLKSLADAEARLVDTAEAAERAAPGWLRRNAWGVFAVAVVASALAWLVL